MELNPSCSLQRFHGDQPAKLSPGTKVTSVFKSGFLRWGSAGSDWTDSSVASPGATSASRTGVDKVRIAPTSQNTCLTRPSHSRHLVRIYSFNVDARVSQFVSATSPQLRFANPRVFLAFANNKVTDASARVLRQINHPAASDC